MNELKNVTGVSNTALSSFMVGGGNSTGGVGWEGKTDEDQIQFWEIRAGYGSINIMNIELLEGRLFSNEFPCSRALNVFKNIWSSFIFSLVFSHCCGTLSLNFTPLLPKKLAERPLSFWIS